MKPQHSYKSVNVCRRCRNKHLHISQQAGDLCAECQDFEVRGIHTIEQYNNWLIQSGAAFTKVNF